MNYFAYFKGYLCTANADGSIPLNSQVVCRCEDGNEKLMQELLKQANAYVTDSRQADRDAR
jgi:hypothetical protein